MFAFQMLAFSEQNLATCFERARKLASAARVREVAVREVASVQFKLVKRRISDAERHIRELGKAANGQA